MKDDQLDPVFILCYPEDFDDHLVDWAKNEVSQNPEKQAELQAFQQSLGHFRQVLDQANTPIPEITLSASQRALILKEAQAKAQIFAKAHGSAKYWWLNGPIITYMGVLAVGLLFFMTKDMFKDQSVVKTAKNQAQSIAQNLDQAKTEAIRNQAMAKAELMKQEMENERAKEDQLLKDKIMLAKLEEDHKERESSELKRKMAPSKSQKLRANDRNSSKKKIMIGFNDDDSQAQATNAFPHSQIEIAEAEKTAEKAPTRKEMDQSANEPQQEYAPSPPKPVAVSQGDQARVELGASSGSSARAGASIGASEDEEGIQLAQAPMPSAMPQNAKPMAKSAISSKTNTPANDVASAQAEQLGPVEAQSDKAQSDEAQSDEIGGKGEDLLTTARKESKKRNFELALEKYMLWIEGHLEDVQLSSILKEAKAIARRINDAQAIRRIESIEDDLMKPDEKKENRAKKSKAVDLQLDGF
jgi:Tfp pilus assembly protein FimT